MALSKEEAEELEYLTLKRKRLDPYAREAMKSKFQKDVERAEYSPTVGMGGAGRFAAGIGKSMTDIGQGIGRLTGISSAENVRNKRYIDKPISETRAGQAGEIVGAAASALPLAFAPGANTVAGSAGYGALFGGLMPWETPGELGTNMATAGAASGAFTGLARAIPALYNAAVMPFTAKGQDRISLDTISRFAKNPNALRNANPAELIPGSSPTLAEVTGDPGIAQLQRSLQAASPEFASMMAENKSARMAARKDALLKITGSHDDRLMMEEARRGTADKLYKEAYEKGVDIRRNPETGQFYSKAEIAGRQGEITKLLKRPAIQEALKDARTLAANEGVKMNDFAGSVKGLDYVKRALDRKIESAVGRQEFNEARVLGDLRDRMLTTIDTLSPKYAEARGVYAEMSKPINRAEVGAYLYGKLIPVLSDLGSERITPAQYAKALSEGDDMAKKATGFKGAKLRDVLSEEDMTLLINLGKDLGRESGAIERAKVPGSPTAQYMAGRNALRQILGPIGMPEGWVDSVLADTFGSRGISALAKPVESKLQQRLGTFLVSPTKAQAAANQLLSARQQRYLPLSELAEKGLPALAIGSGAYRAQE